MTIKTQHIHKFKRLRYKSGNETFFCALPDCNQKINPSLTLGKRSICWRCGEPFIMNEYSLRLAKPHCESCHKSKKIDAKLDDIIIISPDGIVGSDGIVDSELSLADRLQQTIKQTQAEEEEL